MSVILLVYLERGDADGTTIGFSRDTTRLREEVKITTYEDITSVFTPLKMND